MNIYRIENEAWVAEIAAHGAELKSLRSKKTDKNYIYDGSAGWKRSSPVLFPNIGGLAEETLVHNGVRYPAKAHGFARDMDFALKEKSDTAISFNLSNDESTAEFFPFMFGLTISYELTDNGVKVFWHVENHGEETMYFSIGAHPGFCLLPGTKLEDYSLSWDVETAIDTRRVMGRFLTKDTEHIADPCNHLDLSSDLLQQDAIIMEDTGIQKVWLKSHDNAYRLSIEFPNFPVVAIWTDTHALPDAKFVCIEPWCGINSLCDERAGEIALKDRVSALKANQAFDRYYCIGIEE